MKLNIPENHLFAKPQRLEMDKIAVLIGKNGSGKSAILESIFRQKLEKGRPNGMNVVCFSSGQNERYSKIYGDYMKRGKGLNNLKCALYDKPWSKLTIFLAAVGNPEGRVRKYLQDTENGYVSDSHANLPDLEMVCNFKFRGKNADRVKKELIELNKFNDSTVKNNFFLNYMNNYITEFFGDKFEIEKEIPKGEIAITADRLKNIELNRMVQISGGEDSGIVNEMVPGNDFGPEINFFTEAAFEDNFIEKGSIRLNFNKKEVELDNLSDGEYQLLFLYALIDLFDSANTLFLIDEADTHLHQENIENVWTALREIEGYALTATHLIDSIIANRIIDLYLVENGEIVRKFTRERLIERLKVKSLIRNFEFELYGKSENLVIMDDECDWEIFVELARQKGLNTDFIESFEIIKMPSGYSSYKETLGKSKVEFINEFLKYFSDYSDIKLLDTKRIFMICDRDEANLNFQDGVEVMNPHKNDTMNLLNKVAKNWINRQSETMLNGRICLLAWPRREIENYLVCHKAFRKHGILKLINNDDTPKSHHLRKDSPCDNETIRNINIKSEIKKIFDTESKLYKEKRQEYIVEMPSLEISDDIEKMCNLLRKEIQR